MAYFTFTINSHTYSNDPASGLAYGYKFIGYEYIPALGNLFTDLAATVAIVLGYKDAADDSAQAALASEDAAHNSAVDADASAQAAASSATGLQGTSTTSLAIGTGTKVFATQSGKQFNNTWIRATDAGNSDNWMLGYATYSGTSLSLAVASGDTNGSGTHATWLLSVNGPRGLTGATGSIGSLQTATDFAQDTGTTTALTYGYKAGDFRSDNVVTHINAGTIAVTNNTTNYVQATAAGVTVNTTGFTSGSFPMATVVAASGAITTVTDKRAFALSSPSLAGGATPTTSGSNITLTASSNRVQTIIMTARDLYVSLPVATGLPTGGALYVCKNAGAIPFTIRDSDGNIKVVLNPGQIAVFYLNDNTGAGDWAIGNQSTDGSSFQPYYNGTLTAITAVALATSNNVQSAALDATHALVAYYDNSASKLYTVLLTLNTPTSFTFGTAVDCGSTNVYAAAGYDLAAMSSTKAILIYGNGGTGQAESVIVTFSGTTPVKNTAKVLYGELTNSLAVCALSSSAAISAVCGTGNLHVSYLSAASTTITEPSTFTQVSNNCAYPQLNLISASGALLTFQDTTTGYAYGAIVSISGTTASRNAETALSAITSTFVTNCVASATRAIAAWANSTTNGQAVPLTLTSTTVTPGTIKTYKTTQVDYCDIQWAGCKAIVTYRNASGYGEQSFLTFGNSDQNTLEVASMVNQLTTVAAQGFGTTMLSNNKMITGLRNGSSTFLNGIITDIPQ